MLSKPNVFCFKLAFYNCIEACWNTSGRHNMLALTSSAKAKPKAFFLLNFMIKKIMWYFGCWYFRTVTQNVAWSDQVRLFVPSLHFLPSYKNKTKYTSTVSFLFVIICSPAQTESRCFTPLITKLHQISWTNINMIRNSRLDTNCPPRWLCCWFVSRIVLKKNKNK